MRNNMALRPTYHAMHANICITKDRHVTLRHALISTRPSSDTSSRPQLYEFRGIRKKTQTAASLQAPAFQSSRTVIAGDLMQHLSTSSFAHFGANKLFEQITQTNTLALSSSDASTALAHDLYRTNKQIRCRLCQGRSSIANHNYWRTKACNRNVKTVTNKIQQATTSLLKKAANTEHF